MKPRHFSHGTAKRDKKQNSYSPRKRQRICHDKAIPDNHSLEVGNLSNHRRRRPLLRLIAPPWILPVFLHRSRWESCFGLKLATNLFVCSSLLIRTLIGLRRYVRILRLLLRKLSLVPKSRDRLGHSLQG